MREGGCRWTTRSAYLNGQFGGTPRRPIGCPQELAPAAPRGVGTLQASKDPSANLANAFIAFLYILLIHPLVDGNGRTALLLLNAFGSQSSGGLVPVALPTLQEGRLLFTHLLGSPTTSTEDVEQFFSLVVRRLNEISEECTLTLAARCRTHDAFGQGPPMRSLLRLKARSTRVYPTLRDVEDSATNLQEVDYLSARVYRPL